MNAYQINPPSGFRATFSRLVWWLPIRSVTEVSCEALAETLRESDTNAQLLDVRTHSEWHKTHIRNTVNIPLSELHSRIKKMPFNPEREITVICWATARSAPAVRLLSAWGFERVRQLGGGMKEWSEKGLPVVQEVSK